MRKTNGNRLDTKLVQNMSPLQKVVNRRLIL